MGWAIDQSKFAAIPGRLAVGHDAKGRWVVCDRLGSIGGTFVDRESAIRFARRESDNAPGAVRLAADSEVLDLFASPPRRGDRGRVPPRPARRTAGGPRHPAPAAPAAPAAGRELRRTGETEESLS